MKSSRSIGGPLRSTSGVAPPRSRLNSFLSDYEDRGRERRPSYRRFNEVENLRLGHGGGESSSGEELDRMQDYRPGGPGAARLKRERDAKEAQRRRKEEGNRIRFDQDPAPVDHDDVEEEEDKAIRLFGFTKELEIREVSAKDGQGVEDLFNALLQAIIKRRDSIERERRMRERDSIMLSVPTTVPTWGTLAEEEDGMDSEDEGKGWGVAGAWGGCCRI